MMKFSVSKSQLEDALVVISSIVKPYPILDCHKYILIESIEGILCLTGVDSESSITTYCKYKGKNVLVALPYYPLMKVISVSNKWMDFVVGDGQCSITSENAEFIIPTFNHEDFPKPTDIIDADVQFQFQENFINALKKCADFVSIDYMRKAMTYVCLDIKDSIVKLVATDAHRLICEAFDIIEKKEKQLLIPVKDIVTVPNDSGIFRANDTVFEIQCAQFIKRGNLFTNKNYPDYEAIIPKPKDYIGKIGCNRVELIDALEKIKVISGSRLNHIQISIEDKLILSLIDDYSSMENVFIRIDCSHSGKIESFIIDSENLKMILNSLDGQVVHINLTGRAKAIIVSSNGSKRLTMPILI